MTSAVNSGHPGGSLGCTEFFVALYKDVLQYELDFKMNGIGEDLFFLSQGHISPVFYSVLARCGFFSVQELDTFRKLNSRLQGHPATEENLPGIRIATGSLGQGMSVAIGAALTKKLNHDERFVFTLHGDGELQEGQNWEAIMFAAHNKVDNLIATVDWNNAQIDGKMEDIMSLGDLEAKFNAFNWKTLLLENGNNLEAVIDKLNEAKECSGKGQPVAILMKTKMGKGVDFMEAEGYKWHGKAANNEQLDIALAQLPETLGDY